MAIHDLFSKRQKRELGERPDVYIYDFLPPELRVQIVHAWGDAIGSLKRDNDSRGKIAGAYHAMAEVLRREYGVFRLVDSNPFPDNRTQSEKEITDFFLLTPETDLALDVVEIICRFIDRVTRSHEYLYRAKI